LRLPHRRPSPAIVISSIALFMSLGGVGYAATQLPNGSVGAAQLKTNAVTNTKINNGAVSYKKIQPGAVGTVRANLNQLQARVSGTCSSGQAVASINQIGKVTCNNALPSEFGQTSNSATVGSTATALNSVALPAGASYVAFANPTATVTSGVDRQHVTVTCTLTVGGNTQTRSATVETDGTLNDTSSASIPLQQTGPTGTASVSCQSASTGATAPTVSVTSAVNAIQTAANS
jgi:hypothetical protein